MAVLYLAGHMFPMYMAMMWLGGCDKLGWDKEILSYVYIPSLWPLQSVSWKLSVISGLVSFSPWCKYGRVFGPHRFYPDGYCTSSSSTVLLMFQSKGWEKKKQTYD